MNRYVVSLVHHVVVAFVLLVAACVEPSKEARVSRDGDSNSDADRAHRPDPRANSDDASDHDTEGEPAVAADDVGAVTATPSITIEFVDARGVSCTLAGVELTATLHAQVPMRWPVTERVRLESAQGYVLSPAEAGEWTFTARTSGAVPVVAELSRRDPSSQQRVTLRFSFDQFVRVLTIDERGRRADVFGGDDGPPWGGPFSMHVLARSSAVGAPLDRSALVDATRSHALEEISGFAVATERVPNTWIALVHGETVVGCMPLREADTEVTFVVPREHLMRSFGSIELVAVDVRSEAPLEGLDVALQLQSTGRRAITDAAGRARFEGVPVGEFEVRISGAIVLQACRVGVLRPGDALDLGRIECARLVRLAGRIEDAPKGAKLHLFTCDGAPYRLSRTLRDDGAFEFKLDLGRYLLTTADTADPPSFEAAALDQGAGWIAFDMRERGAIDVVVPWISLLAR